MSLQLELRLAPDRHSANCTRPAQVTALLTGRQKCHQMGDTDGALDILNVTFQYVYLFRTTSDTEVWSSLDVEVPGIQCPLCRGGTASMTHLTRCAAHPNRMILLSSTYTRGSETDHLKNTHMCSRRCIIVQEIEQGLVTPETGLQSIRSQSIGRAFCASPCPEYHAFSGIPKYRGFTLISESASRSP